MTNKNSVKPSKKQGPIRFEALIPLTIIISVFYIYSALFFDLHLKKALEWGGYHVMGAEVNIQDLSTSFFKGSLRIQNIEVTNSQKPTHNSIVLGDIRFKVLWDGLLRARFIVDEVAVDGVQIDTPRKQAGRVKPPSPPSPNDDALTKALAQSQAKALGMISTENPDNVLGGLSRILGGQASEQEIIQQIQSSLTTEKRTQEVEAFIKQKQTEWEARMASLPKAQDFEKIQKDVEQIQSQNFKSIEEVQRSVTQFNKALNELDQKLKQIDQAGKDLQADSQRLDREVRSIESALKSDLARLGNFFSTPAIDFNSILDSILRGYMAPYLAKIGYYRNMAQDYMPPNLGKKGEPDAVQIAMQPRPRADGVTYEFGRPGSYPLFWVKKVQVSSKANANLGLGDLQGQILDITSNQALINKATQINFKGDFPAQELMGIAFSGVFDNRKKESFIRYEFGIHQFGMGEKVLIQSPDAGVKMLPSSASIVSTGELTNFKDLQLTFKQQLANVSYSVTSPNDQAQESLNNIFSGIKDFAFTANISGQLPSIMIKFDTDFGRILGERFSREIGRVFQKHKAAAEAQIRTQLNQEKAKIDAQVKAFETQVKAQFATIQKQAESEKKKIEAQKLAAENQVNQQKQQAEQEARQKVEAERKKAEIEAKKKAEQELKKLFGR